jgi:hypothetical protein
MSNICGISSAADDPVETGPYSIDEFPATIRAIAEQHRPSRLPFFRNLAGLDRATATDPALLGQIHLIYQSAMHATRAAVYYLPHLDNPALRKRPSRLLHYGTIAADQSTVIVLTGSGLEAADRIGALLGIGNAE